MLNPTEKITFSLIILNFVYKSKKVKCLERKFKKNIGIKIQIPSIKLKALYALYIKHKFIFKDFKIGFRVYKQYDVLINSNKIKFE